MDTALWTLFALIFFAYLAFVRILRLGSREEGLPPGPRTLPILGNIASLPSTHLHLKLSEWAKEFGPIYSLKIGTGTTIVLSGAREVHEILERRSAITSDRSVAHVMGIIWEGQNLAFVPYGDKWRLLRRLTHAILTPKVAAVSVLPIQHAETMQLLYDFLSEPQEFYHHIERFSNSTIMSLVFGKRSPRNDTKHTADFYRTAQHNNMILDPSRHPPVDLIPLLKYVPMRWAKWKRDAHIGRQMYRSLYLGLTNECGQRMRDGNENGCYMETLLRTREESGLSLVETAYLGAVMVDGGSDTSSSLILWVVLFLLLHPEVQRKAQKEIDSIVQHRMPSIEDYNNLPYVQAIIRETLRMRPVLALAVPHESTEAQEYKGYIIPKGSTIIPNQWGILHDPNIFEEPENFNPARFLLTEHGTKPGIDDTAFRASMPFGYGRRMCPGIHVANNTLMLSTLYILWAFNISPALDSSGEAIRPDPLDFPSGFTLRMEPFLCQIAPRNTEIAQLIVEEFAKAIDIFKQFEQGLSQVDMLALEERARRFH